MVIGASAEWWPHFSEIGLGQGLQNLLDDMLIEHVLTDLVQTLQGVNERHIGPRLPYCRAVT